MNKVTGGRRREALLREAEELPHIKIGYESGVDSENIAYGVYSPLEGFMNGEEYRSVLDDMLLPNGLPWTIPIVLDASRDEVENVKVGDDATLSSPEDKLTAVMHIEDIFEYDRVEHAKRVFKTTDPSHPGVSRILQFKEILVGGRIELLSPARSPLAYCILHPAQTRILFEKRGWTTIVGFQTRNAPHKGHEYLQKMALAFIDGIFVNPVIGKKKRGDFKDEVILATYQALIDNYYPKDTIVMSVLRYEMKYAGPREAILHAIMRKNFGCTHFIVGRDHAGVGNYYAPYEAQEIFNEFPDLGVTPLFFTELFHCHKCGGIVNERMCLHSEEDRLRFSGTKLRNMITNRLRPPPEIMRPEVTEALLKFGNPFVE